ncbi:MAG: hypothetical protein QGH66_07875 [Dehalococcoidia bacterium]|nr:hypothetical protein [Dehalococcoidia bacterium]
MLETRREENCLLANQGERSRLRVHNSGKAARKMAQFEQRPTGAVIRHT